LCQQVGNPLQLFSVLWGLCTFSMDRGELRTGHELAEQLLPLAERLKDPALLVEAHRALGESWYLRGEFSRARAQPEQGLALYDARRPSPSPILYAGTDPGVHCLSFAALALWHLGYPGQALKQSAAALSLAQELAQPHSLVFALFFAAWLHQLRREGSATQER